MSKSNFKLIALLLILLGIVLLIVHLCVISILMGSNINSFLSPASIIKMLGTRMEYLTPIDIVLMLFFLLMPPLFMNLLNNKFTAFIFSILFSWFLLCLWGYYHLLENEGFIRIQRSYMLFGESLVLVVYAVLWFKLFSAFDKTKIKGDSSPFELSEEAKKHTPVIALVSLVLSILSFLFVPLWFIFFPDIRVLHFVQRYIIAFSIGQPYIATSEIVIVPALSMISVIFCSPCFILSLTGGHLVRREHRQHSEIRGSGTAAAALVIGYLSVVLIGICFLLLLDALPLTQLMY